MADVTVDIEISLVNYKTWLTTSYISSVIVSEDGKPLIKNNELGPDQEDAVTSFMEEAAREVLKLFLSRQGNVTGVPFTFDGSNAIYLFNEELPALIQAEAIKSALNEDIKNALFTYVTALWLKIKGNEKQYEFLMSRFEKFSMNINNHLYKLHD